MPDTAVNMFPVSRNVAQSAWVSEKKYFEMYEESIRNPDKFWGEHGKRIDWVRPFTKVKNTTFDGNVSIKWFEDGTLNASYNCIDRHLKLRADQTAILWEGDDPAESRHVSYGELHESVCRLGNVLKGLGVKKGDRVTIYMPMIPQGGVRHVACARIGAVHSVVFGGFSPESLELAQWVRKQIGAIAAPDFIQWAPGLPKTRAGKIMRRILRKIAANEQERLGDTSTLADPAVVNDLVGNRLNRG